MTFDEVMKELKAIYDPKDEWFDKIHDYCFKNYGNVMGRFYFQAFLRVRDQ